MAASVWMTPRIRTSVSRSITRWSPETTPLLKLASSPKGLPMARTDWPTRSPSLSPRGIAVRSRPAGSILITARSCSGTAPTSTPSRMPPSAKLTRTMVALATTCQLVTIHPPVSHTNPDPVPSGISTGTRRPPRRNVARSTLEMPTTAGRARSKAAIVRSSSVPREAAGWTARGAAPGSSRVSGAGGAWHGPREEPGPGQEQSVHHEQGGEAEQQADLEAEEALSALGRGGGGAMVGAVVAGVVIMGRSVRGWGVPWPRAGAQCGGPPRGPTEWPGGLVEAQNGE